MSENQNINNPTKVENVINEKPEEFDPYKKYKEFQWEDADKFKNGPISDENRQCKDMLSMLYELCIKNNGIY